MINLDKLAKMIQLARNNPFISVETSSHLMWVLNMEYGQQYKDRR